jgi:AcrR family transcriptional regulator
MGDKQRAAMSGGPHREHSPAAQEPAEPGEGGPPRRSRDPARTRRRILDAAQHLFSTRGYVETSLREITRLAGVNLALANHHFGSKEKLFEAALEELLSADVLMESRAAFGEAVLARLMQDRGESGPGPLPMLIFATADPGARQIAMRLLTERVAEPLAAWLPGEDAQARAAHLLALTAGITMYRTLYPLDPYQGPMSPAARRWLVDALQSIVEAP